MMDCLSSSSIRLFTTGGVAELRGSELVSAEIWSVLRGYIELSI